ASGRACSLEPRPGQLEVDLLEGRPAHVQILELDAFGERLRGQLVEDARRLVRLDDDLLAVPAVADLRRRRGAAELGRAADRDDAPLAEDGDAVGQLLRLVEVMGRE